MIPSRSLKPMPYQCRLQMGYRIIISPRPQPQPRICGNSTIKYGLSMSRCTTWLASIFLITVWSCLDLTHPIYPFPHFPSQLIDQIGDSAPVCVLRSSLLFHLTPLALQIYAAVSPHKYWVTHAFSERMRVPEPPAHSSLQYIAPLSHLLFPRI